MKTLFKSAMVMAAAAMAFAGCSKEEVTDVAPEHSGNYVTLSGKAQFGGTRVELSGEKSVHWTAGDELAIVEFVDGNATYYGPEASSTNYKSNPVIKTSLAEGGEKAEFKAELEEQEGESYKYYAVYPHNAFYSVVTEKYPNLSITFPTAQTPSNDFADPAAAILVGQTTEQDVQGGAADFYFKHLAAYVKLTIKGIPAETKLTEVTVSSEDTNKKISGAFYWYYDEESNNAAGTASATKDHVVVNAENLTAGADGDYTVWFAVHPIADLTNFKVTASCDNEEAYTATYDGTVTVKAGHVATPEISVAEDKSDFSGTYVVVGKEDSGVYHLMTNDSKTMANGALKADDFTYTESVKTDDKTIVWIVAKEGSKYSIKSAAEDGKYLTDFSGTSGGTKWSDTPVELTFTPHESNGTFQILSPNNYYLSMRKNNGSDRFGFYTGTSHYYNLYLIPAQIVDMPKIEVANKVSVEADGGSSSFDVTLTNVTSSEAAAYNETTGNTACTWLTVTHTSGSSSVAYTAEANTDTDARTAYIIIKASNENGETSAVVEVVQAGTSGAPAEPQTFTVKSADVVNNSSYAAYTKTGLEGRNYAISFGGNNYSLGTNSNNRTKCNLSATAYTKYAVSPVTTSTTATVFACTTELSNVTKIAYTVGGGSSQASTKVYIIYSEDNTTFKQIELTSGTQGAALATNGDAFEFDQCTGYFAVLLQSTNSSGNWRIDNFDLTFTYYE